MNKEPVYTLNCDNCGEPYESQEGFPKPQLCPKCQPSSEKPPEEPPVVDFPETELEFYMRAAAVKQRDADVSWCQSRIEQARKEERRKLIEEARHTCPHMRGHCSLLKELEEAK